MNTPAFAKRFHYWLIGVRFDLLGRLPHPEVRKGDKFMVIRDLKAGGTVHWKAPFSSGFNCVIPEGTVLVAAHDSVGVSMGFGCVPANATELESALVPEEDRTAEKYGGYSVTLPYRQIGRALKKC